MAARTALLVLLAGISVVAGAAPTAKSQRWLPDLCRQRVELDAAQGVSWPEVGAEGPDARWNLHYAAGFRAVEAGDLDLAEHSFCRALAVARGFEPRDWRFAESLDELGLVAHLQGDPRRAESLQGAAVAEMLLARGPGDEDPNAADCRSSVTVYLQRLRFVLEGEAQSELADRLEAEPERIFELGYLPLDKRLAGRLEWLISQYLLAENLLAAERLSALRLDLLAGR